MRGLEFMLWDGMDSNAYGWVWDGMDINAYGWVSVFVYRPQSSFERIIWEDMRRRYRRRK